VKSGATAKRTRPVRSPRPPDIVDLGIRLADVKVEHLETESVTYRKNAIGALRRYGASREEMDSLWTKGERVELNAFTSDQFIAWLERKLKKHGVKKVIPDTAILADAYRRAVMLHHINEGLDDLETKARKISDEGTIPKTLVKQIAARLKKNPATPWDTALADIAAEDQADDEDQS
jgi:hypothetical protein